MAHYNLYSSLNLDPSADSATLTSDIERRLAATDPSNAALYDELSTAHSIFSRQDRREQYDRAIADPFGPEVDVARIREIATSGSGVQLMPQPSTAQASSNFNVDLSNFSFAVEPSRQRAQSIQWCIVWGLLAFMWIISTIRGLGALAEVGNASSVELLYGADDYVDEASSAGAFFFMVAGGTPVYLMIAEFIWSLRKTLGRKQAEKNV
ncbi:J domain-containing protein [Corynebacterium guaraldiae]|uniref:J domain-containing protein n=1 Tax=Corynebacterium guaraldiae TaxID=3051103 RepID=UPI0011777BC4|nr:J domain-containing protein [Corynebacterium guaraldiae]TRX32458.1 J domain-containing protein [Corynebacterium guaraldiae]